MTAEEYNLVLDYVRQVQIFKDRHNEDGAPINYGTICTLAMNGWDLIEKIKSIAVSLPEPKIGQWIEHKTDDGRSWLECPICHIKKQYPITNFCPKCGSRNTEKDIPDEDGWVW